MSGWRLSFTIRKASVRQLSGHAVIVGAGYWGEKFTATSTHGRPPTTNLQPLSMPRATMEKRSADDQCLIWDV